MTSGRAARQRGRSIRELEAGDVEKSRKRRLVARVAWGVGVLVVAAVVMVGLVTSRPSESAELRPAPPFTLTDTSGETRSLSDFRGQNVVLFFSEGAGCQACLVQMAEIEKASSQFAAQNLVVLPIVMNTRDQILADMAANGVRTPFLLDDGSVSAAYGTIGKGMHSDLPGHSFVVVDAAGMQRWYGEYPGMWLDPDELLAQAAGALAGG
ncbi:MAG: peroxiredoxin family protein [Candidatus Nanopelagicales bacterium]